MGLPIPQPRPAPIRTDGSNPFAAHTMQVRLPKTIETVCQVNANYPLSLLNDLTRLAQAIQRDEIIPMIASYPTPPPDFALWQTAFKMQHATTGQPSTWLNAEWFFAETVFYRHIIDLVRWAETDRDPFAPLKAHELQQPSLWHALDQALSLEGDVTDRLPTLFKMAMWGNRIDLSHVDSAKFGVQADDAFVVVDDAHQVVQHLIRAQGSMFNSPSRGAVHFVLDNAGTELAFDLALADALLSGVADEVVLHVKYCPTFVSDATTSDVRELMNLCASGESVVTSANIINMGKRLVRAFVDGRLRTASHAFWNSSHFLWQLADELAGVFAGSLLVILKGDLNYRRAVGDALWTTPTTWAEATAYFPAPLLTLRTLKSDALVGIPADHAELLTAQDPHWRTNGKRGVIQLKEQGDTPSLG